MVWNITLRSLALLAISSAAAFAQPLTASETLDRYLNGPRSACGAEEQAMEIEIHASLPKLKKQGTMQGMKVISESGQVAYRFLRFTGDKLVKTDVIARFMTAEAQPPENRANIRTTLENYKFHYLRAADYQGAKAYVFQLRPRKKRVGLYKGELWLDAESAAVLREAGEMVKSPSIFINRVRFVRDNPERASCRPPQRTTITVQTRIVGDAEMLVLQHPVGGDWHPADAEGSAVSQPGFGDLR